jgi:16S rRNA pseudouridine516 synthase
MWLCKSLKMKKIRADRLLSNLGYGSRREVAIAMKAGSFMAGGVAVTDPGQGLPLDPKFLADATYRDEKLDPVAPLTVLLNKPRGYTCSHDEQGLLVYDLLPERWSRRDPVLSTAGRLDKESTGFVLLTDDGDLLHKIISPKHHVWKQYRVTLRDPLNGDEAAVFASGDFSIDDDRVPLKPARWVVEGGRVGVMSLQEGRYHQIRRMFKALGNHVEDLHRFQVGGLSLGELPEGAFRILEAAELSQIFEN